MLIGIDYPKMSFDFLGLHLLELNGFIGNIAISLLSFYYYRRLNKLFLPTYDAFILNWSRFYLTFSLCFLSGGFGHLLFHYTHVAGKAPSWFLSILSVYFIERATLSLNFHPKTSALLRLSAIKLLFFIGLETFVVCSVDMHERPEIGLLIPSLHSTIGLVFCLGFMGRLHEKKIHISFKYQWISVFVLAFSSIVQILKMNIHPFFDRNDLSHFLLIITLILFYSTICKRNWFRVVPLHSIEFQSPDKSLKVKTEAL